MHAGYDPAAWGEGHRRGQGVRRWRHGGRGVCGHRPAEVALAQQPQDLPVLAASSPRRCAGMHLALCVYTCTTPPMAATSIDSSTSVPAIHLPRRRHEAPHARTAPAMLIFHCSLENTLTQSQHTKVMGGQVFKLLVCNSSVPLPGWPCHMSRHVHSRHVACRKWL